MKYNLLTFRTTTISLVLITLSVCFCTACNDNDDDDSNNDSNTTVILTENDYTEDGYFDGILYYKITSNARNEVTIFKSESNEEMIVIPSTVKINGTYYKCTDISDDAFCYSQNLVKITIPSTITSIGRGAFRNCTSLQEVHISDLAAWCKIKFDIYSDSNSANPLVYAEHLYLNGEEITDLVIPNSITKISNYAFYNCKGFTSITIPNSIVSIGIDAFFGCRNLEKVYISDLSAWCEIKFDDGVSNPFTYAEHLYCNGQEIIDLVIPNNVTTIGNSAFDGCSGLVSVTIPNSVTTIGNSAFSGCSGLVSVTIPNSVTIIGNSAFDGCSGLRSIDIPNSVLSIGNYAFSRCSSLTNIVVPNSVTSIGHYAFSDCGNLQKVIIGDGVTTIAYGTFLWCTSLQDVAIGKRVTIIGERAFDLCRNLTSITIPNSVINIEREAFFNCDRLLEITIGSGVAHIGVSAFRFCSNLKKIYITDLNAWCRIEFDDVSSNPLVSKGHLYLNGEEITDLVIPNDITKICNYAFYNCTGLKEIVIPNSVTNIETQAFAYCKNLTFVHCQSITPPLVNHDTFDTITLQGVLYVPTGARIAYQSADGWNRFINIVEE